MPSRLDPAAFTRMMLFYWMVSAAPSLLLRFARVRAEIEAQPSPATWYLQKWHNRC